MSGDPVPAGTKGSTAGDGRVLRGERTRSAIVDALLSLLGDGVLAPTAAQIAERAGVSVRSVFQHFEDLEALHVELAVEQARRVAPLLEDPPIDGPLAERIAALVDQRAELYEFITPVRHALGARVYGSPVIRRRVDELSNDLRAQLERCFATELDVMGEQRTTTLDSLEVVTSFSSWDQLREFRSVGRSRAAATMRRMVEALLQSPGT